MRTQSLADALSAALGRHERPDLFGLEERDVVIEFDRKCGCGVAAGIVHYRRAKHAPTQTVVEFNQARHGDPHFKGARLRMVRDLALAATGQAPTHPQLDDWRYDKEFQGD